MRTLALAFLLVPAVAAAEPTRYLQIDGMFGASAPVGGPNLLAATSFGYRLAGALWARGELAAGPAADDQGGGTAAQVRGGVEARACTSGGLVCAIAGLDLGGLRGTWIKHDMSEHEEVLAVIAVPRFGLDIGGRQWRGRLGIEVDEAIAGTHTTSYSSTEDVSGTIGAELVAGAAYQW